MGIDIAERLLIHTAICSLNRIGVAMSTFSDYVAAVLPPVHLLAYSTLLGTELYQTFVMTKVSYQALPRSAFTTLQKRVFPIYFQSQSILLLIVAATFPPCGPLSLLAEKSDWIAFAVAGVTAGFNFVVFGPRTKDLMVERVHQGKYPQILSNSLIADGKTSDSRWQSAAQWSH